jgi:hypothetical protein
LSPPWLVSKSQLGARPPGELFRARQPLRVLPSPLGLTDDHLEEKRTGDRQILKCTGLNIYIKQR